MEENVELNYLSYGKQESTFSVFLSKNLNAEFLKNVKDKKYKISRFLFCLLFW